MYIYIYQLYINQLSVYINLQTAVVSLFESSLAQLRSNEDLEGPEFSYHYYHY